MDHSERRFGERDWSSERDFEAFMRQNDPNRQRNERSPPNSHGGRSMRASETSMPRPDFGNSSPYSNMNSAQRRNTYDPSVNHLRVPADPSFSHLRVPSSITQSVSPISSLQSNSRPSFGGGFGSGRPKALPLGDDDISYSDDDDDESSEDQKPAAVRRQQVPAGGIEAPVMGSPYASMVQNNHHPMESTMGGAASSFPRSEDRWQTGGAPSRNIISTTQHTEVGPLPTPIAVPPPRPNYLPLEPSIPESRLGRRCLIHKPKREPDLVKGLVVAGVSGTIRSRDTTVVNCAKCGAELNVPRAAIVISCPSCYRISPAASCKTVNIAEDF